MRMLKLARVVVVLLAFGLVGCKPRELHWLFSPEAPSDGCEVLSEIATDKLAKDSTGPPTDIGPRDPSYQANAAEIRQQLQPDLSSPPGADAEIRTASFGGLSDSRGSTIAWRVNGIWTTSMVSQSSRDFADGSHHPTKHTAVLGPLATARLNQLLSGGCVWKTPVLLVDNVPLKNGSTSGICLDGVTTYFDIRDGQRRWRGAQYCGPYGTPGQIALILSHAPTGNTANSPTRDRRLILLNRTEGTIPWLLPMPLALLQYGVVALWAVLFVFSVWRFRWRGLWALAALPLVWIGWFMVMHVVQNWFWAWAFAGV